MANENPTITTDTGSQATVVAAPAGLAPTIKSIPSSNLAPTPTGNERVPKAPVNIPDFSKMEDMSIDDVDITDSGSQVTDTKVATKPVVKTEKPEVVVQDTKAEEIKQEVEKQQEEVQETTTKVEPPVQQKKDLLKDIAPKPKGEQKKVEGQQVQRDYTGFSQEEQAVLKQMSNPAFEFTTKLIKENKELSTLKDAHYLQSPDGYMLTPEYKQLAVDSYRSGIEAQLWQQQLIAIRDGKEWKPIVGWDKSGQPAYGNPQQPTTQAEEQVRMAMNQCIQVQQQTEGRMQVLPQQYQNRRQQDLQAVNGKMQEMFSWERDPKILDSMAPMGDGTEKPIKVMRDEIISLFPVYERQSPGVRAAANLGVALKIYAARINELESQVQVAQTKTQEVQRGEPTSTVKPAKINGGKVIGKVATFDMAGLPD